MNRTTPLFAVLIALVCALSGVLVKPAGEPEAVRAFGRLPILAEGRMKPLDSVARSTLLVIQGRQRVMAADGREVTPDQWLLDAMFYPERADTYRTFVVDNTDLLLLLGRNDENLSIHYDTPAKQAMALVGFLPTRQRRFSFAEIEQYIPALERQYKLAEPVDAQARTQFQSAVVQLYDSLARYVKLRRTVLPEQGAEFLTELLNLDRTMAEGIEAVRAKQAGQPHDEAKAQAVIEEGQKFMAMSQSTDILPIPPEPGAGSSWRNTGQALLESFGQGSVNPSVLAYVGMGYAWRHGETDKFAHILGMFSTSLHRRFPDACRRVEAEALFNQAEPFYTCMVIYLAAFILAVLSWLRWQRPARASAWALVALAWVLATAGIAVRMWLESRPPVTNLYSSALFIGWLAVLLCLFLEWTYKNAIGSAAAGAIGFATLLIAHHLALAGDTMEMMRAVLDSNFWLTTHVLVVTAGYSATFLAGVIAVFYVALSVFAPGVLERDKELAQVFSRVVYGIVCFATLFSFTGTTLGGIWADQSWGRFWGWDPKENGALIIVLWNALILHARWGGMVRARGLMCLAIFGNIVTAWSWFGTNMLGVGLHSYGFTQAAFWGLTAFIAANLALIILAFVPLGRPKAP